MKIPFSKYHGTGNDFILIDNYKGEFSMDTLSKETIESLCHRRFGIGADGFIILEKSDQAAFNMVYYNSDGRISSMCGNGSRCILRFAHDRGHISDVVDFMAIDGKHYGKIGEMISVHMSDVEEVTRNDQSDFVLDTGSPHYVKFLDDVHDLSLVSEAHAIRYSDLYKEQGINVNFVQMQDDDSIFVRTYERGVEDETYSCGTGVVASAISTSFKKEDGLYGVQIETLGGKLEVRFEKDKGYRNIWLTGPAVHVFDGVLEF